MMSHLITFLNTPVDSDFKTRDDRHILWGFVKGVNIVSSSFERREVFRHEIIETKKIEYARGAFDTETFEAFVLNISDTGICFLTSNLLSIGQEITLKDFDIYGSSKTATVQWIEKADKRRYKVGLIF